MQNIMHDYANRLESGGAIDHLPASEASPMLQRDCERSEHVASIVIILNYFIKFILFSRGHTCTGAGSR